MKKTVAMEFILLIAEIAFILIDYIKADSPSERGKIRSSYRTWVSRQRDTVIASEDS
jgi:hypothetical protein